MSKAFGDSGTCDVVHLNRQHADACSLVAEREVNTFFGHSNTFHLRIDVYIGILIESSLARSNARYLFSHTEKREKIS